ncbi:hypothetical protein [Adlercreutzia mucosicola]|uniref:hypothetical protein n=1 Tax=Adlercreutzia mucosicola TaxID=580026 RepID=UPI00214CA6FF|nr:hypothetical protein [Adlercreutzia mucosicola]
MRSNMTTLAPLPCSAVASTVIAVNFRKTRAARSGGQRDMVSVAGGLNRPCRALLPLLQW